MSDRRPSIAGAHARLGVPARVTRPGMPPILTTAICLPDRPVETGDGLRVRSTVKVLGLRRDEVPTAPRETLIDLLEGEDAGTYSVEGPELAGADLRVAVVRL